MQFSHPIRNMTVDCNMLKGPFVPLLRGEECIEWEIDKIHFEPNHNWVIDGETKGWTLSLEPQIGRSILGECYTCIYRKTDSMNTMLILHCVACCYIVRVICVKRYLVSWLNDKCPLWYELDWIDEAKKEVISRTVWAIHLIKYTFGHTSSTLWITFTIWLFMMCFILSYTWWMGGTQSTFPKNQPICFHVPFCKYNYRLQINYFNLFRTVWHWTAKRNILRGCYYKLPKLGIERTANSQI